MFSLSVSKCGLTHKSVSLTCFSPCCADETVTLSEVLERLSSHLAQIKVLHKVFCTGVAEVPPETPNVVRASHLLNTLYKAIIEYDSIGEASEQGVSWPLFEFTQIAE